MKKALVIILSIIMLCAVAVSASAEPIKPEGFTTTILYDFSSFGDTTCTIGEAAGFWAPDPATGAAEIVCSQGTVTFNNMNIWGAFPSFINNEQIALTQSSQGWGFYVKNEGLLEVTVGGGFNSANGKNYVPCDGYAYLLVDMEGNVTEEYSIWNSANTQGAFVIPEEFEGYIYIPFNLYFENDGNASGDAYDSTAGIVTPIFSLNDGEMLTYGEMFVFSSDYVFGTEPTPEPTPEVTEAPTADAATDAPTEVPTTEVTDGTEQGPGNNGWILWVAIAAVVVIAIVVVIVTKKKSK